MARFIYSFLFLDCTPKGKVNGAILGGRFAHIEFSAQPWRCRTCNNRGSFCRRVPLSELPSLPREAFQEYFAVTDDEIRREFPTVLICREERKATMYLTPRFFFEMAQRLYECFNSREVRRHMVSLYAANALTEAMRMEYQDTISSNLDADLGHTFQPPSTSGRIGTHAQAHTKKCLMRKARSLLGEHLWKAA